MLLLTNYNEQNDQSKIINIQRPHTKKLIKINVIEGRVYEVEVPRTENFLMQVASVKSIMISF